jgi:HK97 family phage portal protein
MANLIQKAARSAVAYALFGPRSERRSSLENPQTPLSFPAEWLLDIFNGGRTDSGIRVSELTALQVSTVMSCVNVISRGVGMLPFNVFERNSVGKRVAKYKAHDHYLFDTLRKEPNCEMTAATFFRTFMCHLLLWGNAYAEITYDKGGRVHSIWPRNPHVTTPQRLLQREYIDGDWHPAGTLVYRTSEAFNQAINEDGSIKQSGFERIILAENMIHVPGLSIDGRIGQSTIWLAQQIVGLALAAEKYSAKFFGNGAVPRGILEIANEMEEKAIEELRRQWHEAHGGENAHKVAVLTAGMKFTPIAFNAEQSQLLETRKFQRGEIAAMFNVPGHMVGDNQEKGKSNVEQSSIEFLTYTLMPWLVAIEQEFERKLFPDKGQTANKFFPKFDTHLLKYPDAATRATFFNGGKQWGYLNTNDIHEFEDLNPVEGPGGERYWMPINMQDADDPQTLGANAQVEFDKANPEHSSVKPPTPEPNLSLTPGAKPMSTPAKTPATPAKVEKKSKDIETLSRSFVPLMKDGIGRIAHRKTATLADIQRVFKPILFSMAESVEADTELTLQERADKHAQGIETYLKVLHARSGSWTTEKKIELAESETRSAVESFFVEARYADDQPRDDRGRWTPTGAQVLEMLGPTGKEGVNDTKNANFDKATGKYSPDRQQLHDATVDKIVGDREAPTGRPPVAVILGGGTASGKTTASRTLMGDNPNMVRLDPDEIKTHIPEYGGLKEIDPANAAGRVHAESSDVTKQALAATINGRYDLCYDTTTSNSDKASANIGVMKEAGYEVNALFVDIPLQTAIERADLRARESTDPINKGRFVGESYIRENHAQAASVFVNNIKDNPNVGLKQVWDNSQPRGESPTLIYERQGMGEEKIYDSKLWSAYLDKAASAGKRMSNKEAIKAGFFIDNTDGMMDDVTEPNGSDSMPY